MNEESGVILDTVSKCEKGSGGIFCVYGLKVSTNIPFPELHAVAPSTPECHFELLEAAGPLPISEWLFHWYLPSGRQWRSCSKQNSGYLLRFHSLADFSITANGFQIIGVPAVGIPIETVRHLVLDQVFPLCIGLRGREAIHASSVETPFGVCGFVADTGSGKSTLAASFTEADSNLLGDDCLALDDVDGKIVAFTGYPGMRLWSSTIESLYGHAIQAVGVSHYNEKKRIPTTFTAQAESFPLKALFVLDQPDSAARHDIKVKPIPAAEALEELLKSSFRLDPTDRERLAREFKFFCRLLTQVPLYRLSYPRDFSRLPEVRQAILCALQK